MKININHLVVGSVLLLTGIAIRFNLFDTDLGVGEDLVVFVVGLIYLLLGFGLRPVNRFTFLSTLCLYLSVLNFLIVYVIAIQGELGLLGAYLVSPVLVLLPAALLLLIIGIVYPVFKNKSQV